MIRVLVAAGGHHKAPDEIVSKAPAGVHIDFLKPGESLEKRIGEAQALYGGITEAEFRAARALRWVHSFSTGVENYMFPAFQQSPVVLTNIKGLLAVPMAEHAFAMLLSLTRGIGKHTEQTRRREWKVVHGFELSGQTLGIIGLGCIGHEVAKRAHAFSMRVVALDAAVQPKPAYVDRIDPPDRLASLLSESCVVVVCCPLTPATRNLLGRDQFALMPNGGYVLNMSRGQILVENDLAESLCTGKLAGAGLDVTSVEPCPPTSPLWDAPNALITSHSSAYSQHLHTRKRDFFLENLKRFAAGEPLLNVVNKTEAY